MATTGELALRKWRHNRTALDTRRKGSFKLDRGSQASGYPSGQGPWAQTFLLVPTTPASVVGAVTHQSLICD